MEIIKINKSKNNDNLFIKKLNVAAYVRVSTELDIQAISFESQIKYYKNKIQKNVNWNFVNVYADYGISGTKSKNREQFVEMLNEALSGKIDLILTKSVSRFARNTVDTLNYVRILKNQNIGVYFEEENINTLNMTGELLLTVLSSVSQQESKNLSEHMKLAHIMRIKKGKPILTVARIFGYDVDRKNNILIVNPKEAEIVKLIYKLYLEGFSSDKIAKILEDKKIENTRNTIVWYPTSIRYILSNEKYIGDTIKGKSYKEANTYKTKNNYGEIPKYYFRDTHEAIISREVFEKVQIIKERNSFNKPKEKNDFHNLLNIRFFSRRLKCAECGKTLQVYPRKRLENYIIYWRCDIPKSIYKNCNSELCIREDVIQLAFIKCYNKLLKIINDNKTIDFADINKEIIKSKRLKEKYVIQMSNLTDLFINKEINDYQFKEESNVLQNNIKECESSIRELINKKEEKSVLIKEINILRHYLNNNSRELREFNSDAFNELVDYTIIKGKNEKIKSYLIRFIYKNKLTYDIENEFLKPFDYINKSKNSIKLAETIIDVSKINLKKYGIPKVKFIGKVKVIFEIICNI